MTVFSINNYTILNTIITYALDKIHALIIEKSFSFYNYSIGN